MIDPILVDINIGNFHLAIHWYGVIVMLAVTIAAWLAAREYQRRGGNPEVIWDLMPLILIIGIIGARLWYVANSIVGGSDRYLNNPLSIINIPEGGLHIFGGFLFGGIAFLIYARQKKLDVSLIVDSIAPFLLVGQALARPANFINQELYGPPTSLPWGIAIDAAHRMPAWSDLAQFPLETTRFHPTFAYEMIWNLAAAGLLLWAARKFGERLRPGSIFFGWLTLAGIGRVIIETWRPDQPLLAIGLTTSRLVSLLMALAGILLLLVRYDVIHIPMNRANKDQETTQP